MYCKNTVILIVDTPANEVQTDRNLTAATNAGNFRLPLIVLYLYSLNMFSQEEYRSIMMFLEYIHVM